MAAAWRLTKPTVAASPAIYLEEEQEESTSLMPTERFCKHTPPPCSH